MSEPRQPREAPVVGVMADVLLKLINKKRNLLVFRNTLEKNLEKDVINDENK